MMKMELPFADNHNQLVLPGTLGFETTKKTTLQEENNHQASLLDQGVQDELTDPEGVSAFSVSDTPTGATLRAVHEVLASDNYKRLLLEAASKIASRSRE
jgi:hypothetical protein